MKLKNHLINIGLTRHPNVIIGMTARATHIHMARVFLGQARCARMHGNWHATLLTWAANRRLQAAKAEVQQRLFP